MRHKSRQHAVDGGDGELRFHAGQLPQALAPRTSLEEGNEQKEAYPFRGGNPTPVFSGARNLYLRGVHRQGSDRSRNFWSLKPVN